MYAFLPLTALALSALGAGMFLSNLSLFRYRQESSGETKAIDTPSVSVLIPARNEAEGIHRAVESVLASRGTELEVVVLDDGSTDETGDVVRRLSQQDTRVRLIEGVELPDGWNGKQHACYRLAQEAKYDHFLFLDADIRLSQDAISQLVQRKQMTYDQVDGETIHASLLSAFPRQETGTLLEKLLIPMMHFILLCYLPFSRMRSSTHPAYASGCGQLFLTDRDSYQRAGTHQAIRSSRHDGLQLPKAYRQHGLMTDCIDGTELATCRMYHNASEVVAGLLKNANEGIANKRLLLPFTFLLGGAHLLPWVTLIAATLTLTSSVGNDSTSSFWIGFAIVTSGIAIAVGYLPRIVAAIAFRQSWLGAALHPVALLLFLVLQWWAVWNQLRGKQTAWRGRTSS
ncbi:glycosyltransferase family 2 protein [Neorhodopirellula lusitana]|uniref:glycosyltransferase family 2 protein n=1 Tax=Neorhodopirellula lusitana TaxID=445327 RepID=UPI00384BD7AE